MLTRHSPTDLALALKLAPPARLATLEQDGAIAPSRATPSSLALLEDPQELHWNGAPDLAGESLRAGRSLTGEATLRVKTRHDRQPPVQGWDETRRAEPFQGSTPDVSKPDVSTPDVSKPDVSAPSSQAGSASTAAGGAPVCPYPGLRAFDASEYLYFTGRDELIQELLSSLHHHNLVSIVGAASSGKTTCPPPNTSEPTR
ncbi:MAG: hypothetical protein HC771_24175 [Synechococcales cyanobacterium CRU_2_2]|nr:hypothetical protein [Synechococcales cyanobacterium CRU_2_2]